MSDALRFLAQALHDPRERERGILCTDQARARLRGDEAKTKRVLHELEAKGYVLPLARGVYAIPEGDLLASAIAGRTPTASLAHWLPSWFADPGHREHLPKGLDWERVLALGLAVEEWTNLNWEGPGLLIPIQGGAERLPRLSQRLPALVSDLAFDVDEVQPTHSKPVRVPSKAELYRILRAHNDPRFHEAAFSLNLPTAEKAKADRAAGVTEPVLPFPEAEAKLPRGPPFRYRLYAPRAWSVRNLRHMTRGSSKEAQA